MLYKMHAVVVTHNFTSRLWNS